MNDEPPPLPDWLACQVPFRRRLVLTSGGRIHTVDEGEGRPVLLLHGNPTWSYLWRNIIPRLRTAGVRSIAPDLLGLGLSDKPRRLSAHSLDGHIDWIREVVETLDLREVTVVGQDWGGPIAAGIASRLSDRVRGAVFANTAILRPRSPLRTTAFHRFSRMPLVGALAFRGFNFPVPILHRVQGDPASIGPTEKRAYRYPLRRFRDRTAPLALARMVPHQEGHPSLAVLEETERWARSFEGPVALVWGLSDPILGRALRRMRETFAHATVVETEAGHFLQEEVPEVLAEAIVEVVRGKSGNAL